MRNITTGTAANQYVPGITGLGNGNSYTAPEPYIPIGQGFFVIGSGMEVPSHLTTHSVSISKKVMMRDFIKMEDQQELIIPQYSN